MNKNEKHTDTYGRLLVEKARNVKLYSPAFGQFLLNLFPGNKHVEKHILNGFATDTLHCLEAALNTLRHSLNADRIIRHINDGRSEKLLDLAYRINAANLLFRRCQDNDREMPRY